MWPETLTRHHTFYVPCSPSFIRIVIAREVLSLLPLHTIFPRDRRLASVTQFRPCVPSARSTACIGPGSPSQPAPHWGYPPKTQGLRGFPDQQRPAGPISGCSAAAPCALSACPATTGAALASMLPVLSLPLPCANHCPFSVGHPVLALSLEPLLTPVAV